MIRAVIVDDTATARTALRGLLETDPEIQVVAEGRDGHEAVELTMRHRPDIVLMDVDMPHMDGLAATREIMSTCATPILIVTSSTVFQARHLPFGAIEAGALDVFPKPNLTGGADWHSVATELLRKVRVLSQVRVVRRRKSGRSGRAVEPARSGPEVSEGPRAAAGWLPAVVAIGASTGGPMAIRQILRHLPPGYAVPLVIVQHIGDEFVPGLVEWLNEDASIPVVLARDGAPIQPGTATVAPGGVHVRLTAGSAVRFDRGPHIHHCRPSVDVLFHSAAQAFGSSVVGVLLTGMGRDGADGLRVIRRAGGLTVAQDEDSSTVYGMPGAAVEAGAACLVMTPREIGRWMADMAAPKGKAEADRTGA